MLIVSSLTPRLHVASSKALLPEKQQLIALPLQVPSTPTTSREQATGGRSATCLSGLRDPGSFEYTGEWASGGGWPDNAGRQVFSQYSSLCSAEVSPQTPHARHLHTPGLLVILWSLRQMRQAAASPAQHAVVRSGAAAEAVLCRSRSLLIQPPCSRQMLACFREPVRGPQRKNGGCSDL